MKNNKKIQHSYIQFTMARLLIVIFAIMWSFLITIILLSQGWVIYWVITGRNVIVDFKNIFDKFRDYLNV